MGTVNEGKSDSRKEQIQKQIEELSQALVEKPNDPDLMVDLGNAYSINKDSDTALKLYEQAISINKTHWRANHNLGHLLKKLKKYDLAQAAYETALIHSNTQAIVYMSIGNLYSDQKQLTKAKEIYLKALSIEPSH